MAEREQPLLPAGAIMPVRAGRSVAASLPVRCDLIAAVEAVARQAGFEAARFSVSGVVTAFTIGVQDTSQQVYVTHREESDGEILLCDGEVFMDEPGGGVRARIALADQQGRVTGGRLFSGTILYEGEIRMTELKGLEDARRPPPAVRSTPIDEPG